MIFKDCMHVVHKCHSCQTFTCNMKYHHVPIHIVVSIGPFMKRGIYFMTCNLTSTNGHGYIIMVVDYFTKWDYSFYTFSIDATIASLFMFNHIITRFNVPNTIVVDNGSHFHNKVMT